ncbi:MAG TPA: fumarylacetoacetate hydrolase family protein [Burkholderiaceae bacterium]|nr:fumarylacetoacetate hydrolase family protein [Burkholderiaceae bacterium]
MLPPLPLRFEFAPWHLSGIVYGTLLNDPQALAALGAAASAPPYKAPPRAPVLYLKPRNTLRTSGAVVELPAGGNAFEIGAALAVVIGRATCRVRAADAAAHIAGWTLVADLGLPQPSLYRPNVSFKARDGSCLVGPRVVPAAAIADPQGLELRVRIDGEVVHRASTGGMLRPIAQLLQDVSEFMTLAPGDILMAGSAADAPRCAAGQSFAIDCEPIGTLEGRVVTEGVPA